MYTDAVNSIDELCSYVNAAVVSFVIKSYRNSIFIFLPLDTEALGGVQARAY